jgi:hypothetical protein
MAMNTSDKLDIGEVASLLFFTRAAAEADQALVSSRLEAPFLPDIGRTWLQQRNNITPPLSVAGLYRLWDDPKSSRPCARCGSRRLLLGADGGGAACFHGFVTLYCPFCREITRGHNQFHPFRAFRDAITRASESSGDAPAVMPIGAALTRLRELRAADLLNPEHPLEAASLKAAHMTPPVLTGHPSAVVEKARALRNISSPELVARVCALKRRIEEEQARKVSATGDELAPLRGAPGIPSPKTRFKEGTLPLDEYRALLKRKRELNASINPDVLQCEMHDRLFAEAGMLLGRHLTDLERSALMSAIQFAERD